MQGLGFPSWFITPEGDLVSAFSYNALNYNPYWGTRITVGGQAYTPEKWAEIVKGGKGLPAPKSPPAPPPSAGQGNGPVTDDAKNLANVKNPGVPNFIQPYQNVNRGFKQAFGEKDFNW